MAGVDLDQDLDRVAAASRPSRRRSATSALSSETRTRARSRSARSRASFASPTIGYATRMSSRPASAITSASPSFATVMPAAPASTCIRAISGHLCVFVWGRRRTPASRGGRRHRGDVALHHVEVDQQRRRVDLLDRERHEPVPPPRARGVVPRTPASPSSRAPPANRGSQRAWASSIASTISWIRGSVWTAPVSGSRATAACTRSRSPVVAASTVSRCDAIWTVLSAAHAGGSDP